MALSGNKLLDLLNSNDVPIQKSNTKTTGSAPSLKARNLSRQAENEFTANVLNAMAEQNVPIYRQDDIAPVTTTKKKKKDEEEDDRKWFQKGAFEDGYQFGDVMKTILGTASDVAENVGAGVLGMGEKALDAIAYVSPLLAKGQYYQNGGAYHDAQTQKMFNDSFEEGKKWSADFIKKDLYDEEKIAKKIVLGTDENSVLGEKSDALVQSGGQLLATAGLQMAGVPWFLTTGATSFGSQTETALNDGAGYEQAGVSAAVSAGAEILSEKLSGGIRFGGNTLDDVLLKPLTEKIANKTAKTLVNLGVDAVGEGFEEVFSGVVSNLGTAIYKEDDVSDLLFSEQAMDEYLESFIGGAVLGGIGSGVQAIQDSKRIHLSENEQKVVEHEIEKRTKGKTLTAKEENKIRNDVVRDMLRGYISTDTIEEVLGGETYQTYKNAVDSEDALRQEYEELGKKQNATLAETTRYNELHQQMNELKTNSQRNALKEQLGGEVMGLVQNERLAESYNERSRRGQAYQADISKYDEKQRATIQKAIDSGILNNTNRTHEFVDMIAKITADKGVPFDFTNNEKLKESGFAVDGKAVNGYVTKDGVTLNIDSAKSMNSVVGHEITHVLEGTELYQTLQIVVTEYAKSKGDYQGRYDALTKLYEGVEGADVNAELTADLVGDYLFTDTDFVRNLSVQHRNVFQKIYDEIKYLCKVVTAGSKEARELEKVKKAFEDAYKAGGKAQGDTKYSLSYTTDNKPVAKIETDIFDGKFDELTESERIKIVKNAIKGFRPGIPVSGRMINISRKSAEHFTNSDYTDKIRNNNPKLYEDKLNIAQNMDDVVYASTDYINEELKHPRKDNITQFARGDVLLDIGGNQYKANVLVGYTSMQEMVLYDVQDLTETAFETKEKKAPPKLAGNNSDTRKTDVLSSTSLTENGKDVKYSLTDNEGQYADTFYSQMRKVIDGVKQEKLGAASVVNMLRGKGVKAEEIKWSGIEQFLEGKKSVTKAELQEFVKDNSLEIEEQERTEAIQYSEEQRAELDRLDAENDKLFDQMSDNWYALFNDGIPVEILGSNNMYDRASRKLDARGKGATPEARAIREAIKAYDKNELLMEAIRDEAKEQHESAKWKDYTLDGGENYREYLFKMPGSQYTNQAMKAHWGSENTGVLAHARVQDFTHNDDPVLFIEEIQSDWHNAGQKFGYGDRDAQIRQLEKEQDEVLSELATMQEVMDDYNNRSNQGEYIEDYYEMYDLYNELNTKYEDYNRRIRNIRHGNDAVAPEAPYSKNYHEFVLKNLLRKAAEGGYSYLAWTPAEMQEERWSSDYAEGYRIEYEQDIPKFLNKYGKQWGAHTEDISLDGLRNVTVHAIPVTDAMKQSVLYEGQPKYSLSDSDGKQLSKEQQEYFKDSKVRDENGSLKVMYHGTPNGDFTVFKDGTYFTDNKEYADRYQNPSASSISSGKAATNPKTFEVYLDIKKPFDISDAEARDIYINEYIKGGNALGINPYLSDAEYDKIKTVDWTEGEDLRDFLIDNGYDYDGLVLDEGADGGYGDEVSYRGKSYMVFSPEQVKGVVNQTPTSDPDIRFSLSDVGNNVDNHGLAPINKYAHGTQFYGEDMKLETAPVAEKAAPNVRKTKPARVQARTDEAQTGRKKPSGRGVLKDNFVDRGTVFETMSLKTGNRELQAKFKSIGRAEGSAQYFMEHGNTNAKSLKSIVDEVEKSGKTKKFEDYLRHLHNVDRMKVDKPVFGREVTADISRAEAARLEKANPEFKRWADDVYSYNIELREMMVDAGLISRKTAQLWADMYPHYIPIFRVNGEKMGAKPFKKGKEVNVNSPVKRATGGNSKMEPLFETLAQRTEKVFKAVAKNRFGAELEGMMGTTIESETVEDLDEIIDSVEGDFIQEGANGRSPTFTFYKDGEKVTFEITDEMYNTMKPKSDFMAYTNKALNTANNIRRGLLTEYNPAFMLTNPIKDTQDVLINSQHPARTYASYPKAIAELWGKKGQYYQEYMEHGGEQNTYFDGEEKAFVKDESGIRKWLSGISKANNFIERVPRMAEYIASREMGRSIDVSMLDAARVTTDFSAGGDAVKLMNRNGFTFLNASVQGAVQQVRNVREAKAEGVKGWAKLAAKFMVAGLSSELLNHLLWEDDEEYEELSDYVKQSYYVVAKYDDGKFVRIPKGRTVAVIQNGFEQMKHLITGDDEADFDAFAELVISNLAPSNPMENNLIAPIKQALENRAWYGDELVPSRLQDLPAAEQYDETTDSLSKWLGEKTNISPYKINYVLDQYSGAVGDIFLPMLTPEAERGNDSKWADLIAPISDKFTTDSVLKNQNVTDFYDKRDELEVISNGRNATKDDMLKKVYVDAVSWEMSDLYAKKREIQNSDLSDAEKYEAVREIQKKINDLADNALNRYEDVYSDGAYAEVGDRRFNYSEDKDTWYEIKKKNKDGSDNWNYTQEQLFHNKLGVSYSDYWNGKFDPATNQIKTHYGEMNGKRYNYDEEENQWYEIKPKNADGSDSWYYQKEQEVTKALGLSYKEYWDNREEYNFAYDHPQSYALAKSVGGYKSYMPYYDALENWQSDTYIASDKDENGDTIYNSRKKKVQAYLQELDIPEMEKLILYKSVYNSYDSRNYEIIEYLNSNKNLTYEDRVNALRGLGFDVTDDGNISWK